MKLLLKIIVTTFFSIFGLIYNFIAPGTYELIISWNTQPYPYIDAGDDAIWPYFILGSLFFISLWGWNGFCIVKHPAKGICQCFATLLGTFIFLGFTFKFWPVMGSHQSQTTMSWALYTITWCVISFGCVIIMNSIIFKKIK